MNTIKVKIDTNADQIKIVPIGDLHIGDANADMNHIRQTIDQIAKGKNTYCILLGDLIDNAILSSIGDTYRATCTPMDALETCVKLFEPIKHKILAAVPGNHERRSDSKTDGIDLTKLLCMQLGIANRYSETTALLWLQIHKAGEKQKATYSIYITHGAGGGRKAGGKINRLVDFGTIVDADVFLCGHTHSPAVVRQGFFRVDRVRGAAVEVDRLFVNTAAFLQYGGYGDIAGYTPSSRKIPQILLCSVHYRRQAEAIL